MGIIPQAHRDWRDPATEPAAAQSLTTLQERINRLFEDMWLKIGTQHHGVSGRAYSRVAAEADLSTGAEDLRLEIDLPGIDIADLEIVAGVDELTVRGEKRIEREETGRNYYLGERAYGAFARRFRLPPGFDAERAKATYRNGVLNITVPKIPGAKSAVKKILISGG